MSINDLDVVRQERLAHLLSVATSYHYRFRWRVCKRDGEWRIYDRAGTWHDRAPTLVEAHTWATQCAVMDELCEEGGLTRLAVLVARARQAPTR